MSKKIKSRDIIAIILMVCIALYPLISSFFGIDIGDTGIHYTNFIYIYTRRDIAGYSTVLTSIIGNAWLSVFGNLGIWGLNFLEVLLEWGMAAITFFFLKDYCGKIETLIGTLIATISAGCYLNIFNYHQFSVFLLLLLFFLIFKAIKKNKIYFSIIAGVVYTTAVFARFPSIVSIIVLIFYFYGFHSAEKRTKCILKHIGFSLLSAFLAVVAVVVFFKCNHILRAYVTNVLKLKGMAQTETSSYSMGNLIDNLIWDNIKTFASPLILMGATAIFTVAIYFFMKYKDFICKIIVPIVLLVISVVLAKFSYDVNPVNASPQFTTGYNFLFGISACFAIGMFIYEHLNHRRETAMLYLMAIFLPFLVIAGSNVGSKHTIISIWLVAPLLVYNIKVAWNKIRSMGTKNLRLKYSCIAGLCFMVLSISIKFAHMVYNTNNFESLNRTEVTETIIADNFKFLHTTERERKTLDGLYLAYSEIRNDDTPMVVFGTGAGLYPLLETEPYIRAWLVDNTYSYEQFKADLNKNDVKPDVVYCKTNQYFGYDEDVYDDLITMVKRNSYSGKKQVLEQYLVEKEYTLVYEDDYYCLFSYIPTGDKCSYEMLYSVFYG